MKKVSFFSLTYKIDTKTQFTIRYILDSFGRFMCIQFFTDATHSIFRVEREENRIVLHYFCCISFLIQLVVIIKLISSGRLIHTLLFVVTSLASQSQTHKSMWIWFTSRRWYDKSFHCTCDTYICWA